MQTVRQISLLILMFTPAWQQHPQIGRTSHSLLLPKGYSVPNVTRSPDGRFGVLVPSLDEWDPKKEQNKLIDLRSGRTIGVIHAESAPLRANHIDLESPNWSTDSSTLLWRVSGKWEPFALVLIKVSNNKIAWQVNVLDQVRNAALVRIRQAQPDRYRAATSIERDGRGRGPDSMVVDVTVDLQPGKALTLPLKLKANTTNNPKEMDDFPKEAELNAKLTALLSSTGKVTITHFAVTTAKHE